jgi:hypothetical protein
MGEETVVRKAKATWPWLVLALFLLLPIYAISASLAVRSGLFDLRDRTVSDREIQAIWTLVASGIATAVTLIGLLLTRSHNQRMLERTSLDTVVKGLELILGHEGRYAPRARVAGALAALVHLGHPVIAMRTLNAAWEDNAVDTDTATWLISEVMSAGSKDSKIEASVLLSSRASELCVDSDPPRVSWPANLSDEWRTDLPIDARLTIVITILEVLLSRDVKWWAGYQGWAVVLLDDARLKDSNPGIRYYAAEALGIVIRTYGPKPTGVWSFKGGWKSLEKISAEVADCEISDADLDYRLGLLRRLASWAGVPLRDSSESLEQQH